MLLRLLRSVAVVAVVGVAALPFSARADEMPACTGHSLGAAACFSGKLCACVYDRGGSVTGIPRGFRWDCGVLRPKCGEAAEVPATSNAFDGPYPLAVGIDRFPRVDRGGPPDAEPQPVR